MLRKPVLTIMLLELISVSVMASSPLLEEVEVTARKWVEDAQDVPVQLAVFNAQQIALRGIRKTGDFVAQTPNMSFDDSFTYLNSFVVSRGITQINNADSPVAIVVDGVPQNNQKQFKMNLFDVERIEVLKGPQGFLYGRNALGGAVNVISKAPVNEWGGSIRATAANAGFRETSVSLNIPIVEDTALLRLAGNHKEDNGRIDNRYTDKAVDFIDHDTAYKAQLQINPTDNVVIDIHVKGNDFQAGAVADSVVFSGEADDYQRPSSDLSGVTYGDTNDSSIKLVWQLAEGTLEAISGHTELHESYRGDLDFTNTTDNPGGFFGVFGAVGQGQELGLNISSQEFRWLSNEDNKLRWLVGIHGIHTEKNLRTRAFYAATNNPDSIDDPSLLFMGIDHDSRDENKAYSLYSQMDYKFDNNLSLTTGLRYDTDRRIQNNNNDQTRRNKTFSKVQPAITLTKSLENHLVYGSIGTGFRSGGFNAPGLGSFKDETLTNYELGFKADWPDLKMRINGAAFYSEVDDFQYFYVLAGSGAQIISNIDTVSITGAELSLEKTLIPSLTLLASLGLTDSEIIKNKAQPSSSGNQTPKNTRWGANLSLQYQRELVAGIKLNAVLDYERRGKKYWQIDNANYQEPISLLNARAGLSIGSANISLWGKNITNEKYFADYNPLEYSGLLYDLGWLGQPRTYGVDIEWTL